MGGKWKVKVKVTLEQATKAQRGIRGIALLFHLDAIWGWVVNVPFRLINPPESEPVSIV